MKKFNLLMAAGLMSFATVQAQTTIASVGFEPGDTKYTTEEALILAVLMVTGSM